MKKNKPLARRNFLEKIAAGTLGIVASASATENLQAQTIRKTTPWESSSDKKIRIGVVGGGFGSQFF